MNRSMRVWKMLYRDKLSWFYLPWGILAFSFVVNLLIAYFVTASNTDYNHVTGGVTSIFVYLIVIGIILLPQTFPYVLSNSIRRKDYFWGTTAMIATVGLFTSIALTALGMVETRVTDGWVKLYEWFIQYPLSQHAVWIFTIAVLYALLSYFMLRKSTI